ncbi:MAG TPA: FAD-binding protein [Terriglobales bacterium]|nr:FAD-binding protein [Terriglobales bacterium]
MRARLLSETGEAHRVAAASVLLATGGMGQVYRETTNPEVGTADGVAMAFRAGAALSDLEFVQFHPTALYLKGAPRFLLSEALRGEGAYLRNQEMDRFMPKYHPLAELAPRDVVARAIVHELEVSGAREPVVYLDLTRLKAGRLRERFPRIYTTCLKYNVDITTDMIPVRPAAHYAMGGVRTDLDGRASLPGLYAAGEAACTGVHGANRLASNSLLEGLVYGARAGRAMAAEARRTGRSSRSLPSSARESHDPPEVEAFIREVRDVMWNEVGIVRTGIGLKRAIQRLRDLETEIGAAATRRGREARDLQLAGLLIARSALAREESRGAHYRTDFPAHDDGRFRKHSVVNGETIHFE